MTRHLRLAVFTLDSTASTGAVTRFLRECPHEVALVVRSNPYRKAMGGALGQTWRHWRRSGIRLLPWLFVEFSAPRIANALRRRDPLGDAAHARGATLHDTDDVNGAAAHAAIAAARPDLLLSCHFDQIFAPATLALAPMGGINLHPSLLPHHRGPMPAFWALSAAEPTGVTIHRLAPRIDAGGILAQRAVPLPAGISVSAAARSLHDAGVPLLLETLDALAGERVPETAQQILPYCPFPDRSALRGAPPLIRLADLRAALRS